MEFKGRVVLVARLTGVGVSLCSFQVITGGQVISQRLREMTGRARTSKIHLSMGSEELSWGPLLVHLLMAAVSADEPAPELLMKALVGDTTSKPHQRLLTMSRTDHRNELYVASCPRPPQRLRPPFVNCCTSGQMCMLT